MKKNCIKIFIALFIIESVFQYGWAKEYLWAGANQYQLWFQRYGRIQQQLNAMQNAHLSVLRIFLGHRSNYLSWEDPPEAYTFENPVGTFHDENLEKVDYLMSECQKRGIKLIVALSTHSQPYLDKYGAINIYQSQSSIEDHKHRFTHFLNHYNAYLGKTWKECNDVIYAWEIQNEAGIPLIDVAGLTTEQRHEIIRNFLSELATHLKTLDPDTKVSLGIAGYANYYHNGKSGDDIRTLGDIADADIYTLHFYGGNLAKWIDDNLTYCRSIGKLLFVEEFGDTRGTGMSYLKNLYQSICQTCREKGVPWMFWRLGYRKDENTFSLNEDDEVWQEVIAPEALLISQVETQDAWGVNTSSGILDLEKNSMNFKLKCFPNPFNHAIKFYLKEPARFEKIMIFNIDGEIVDTIDIKDSEGESITWQAKNVRGNQLPTGIYLVKFFDKIGRTTTKKILFVK